MTSTIRAIRLKKKAKKIVICWEISQEVKLGPLQRRIESRMVALLKEYVDTFTWSCQDMPGSDTGVIVHKLPGREDCPLEEQNASATYQRAMVTLFHDTIHHEVECYAMT
ncbi:hypothetical protein KIW84_014950 [Lathyrus oleraceus]|uniref:Uncharacterized protein n=1 Tax=Pisum sativum TaxID=3888 RepID=A0A9D5H095_PEA|nr:hypothetical protein KIW84_014950 [Pisum sativum]